MTSIATQAIRVTGVEIGEDRISEAAAGGPLVVTPTKAYAVAKEIAKQRSKVAAQNR